MRLKALIPTEAQEQKTVAAYLDAKKHIWCHVPNAAGTYGNASDGARIGKLARLKKMGQKRGVPDILVFTAPPLLPWAKGAAIELKRKTAGKVAPEQVEWLAKLTLLGWKTAICRGADEAIKQLQAWGY